MDISCQPAKFQVPQLFEFYRGFYNTPQKQLLRWINEGVKPF